MLVAFAGQCFQALERTRLYRELKQSEERARNADRRKDEFLALLGHELRNPLAPILTALQLLELRGKEAAPERAVIDRHVRHMVHLVDDLLDVSRITRGQVELKKEPVELAVVAAKAIEMASPLLEQRSHRFVVSVAPEGLRVNADPSRLAQVIANLLTNAAKYTPSHGRVELSAAREGAEVVVQVKDSGVGISPELLPHLFEPFVQGMRPLDRKEGGLGLGLTLVRSFTELHGGSVSARTLGPGRGSEFVLRFPALERTGTSEPSRPAVALVEASSGKRVLVVDDNRDAADLLAEALEMSGYLTSVAYDGPSGLALARTFHPDLALLDIGLPVMDGYELAERMRKLEGFANLRLVALTGYGLDADRARSRAAGFDKHLVKPVDIAQVIESVEMLLLESRRDTARAS